MTFKQFLLDTIYRYRTQPITTATRESAFRFFRGAFRRVDSQFNGFAKPIWQRGDWDVVVVLDACRVDLMREVGPEYGFNQVNTIWSNASCSIDWINRTFNSYPSEVGDVGYITANPFSHHTAEDAKSADLKDNENLGYLRDVYNLDWHEIGGIETVPPEWLTDHAIEAWRNRSACGFDRMVIHYMQPHEPFITRPEWSYQDPHDNAVLKNLVADDYCPGTSPWKSMISSGEVSPDEFWPIYTDNLRWVLNDVTKRLLRNLDAESVVLTADHGNGLGEFGTWHHPPGTLSPYVRKVPWVETTATDHEEIKPNVASESVERPTQQLDALGYL